MIVMEEIVNSFKYVNELNIYNAGNCKTYSKNEKEFGDILSIWTETISCAREMPALGVSLNRETLKARNKGLWLEFIFNEQMESNGLPFEKLLIQVNSSFYGFNLERYQSSCGYDGRCFYLDLNGKNMADLYKYLNNLAI